MNGKMTNIFSGNSCSVVNLHDEGKMTNTFYLSDEWENDKYVLFI